MKIYARADQNVAYIEGVTELFTGAGVPSRDGDNISILHSPLGQYQIKNIPYTQIQDGSGNGFADAATCLGYLQGIFRVQLNAYLTFPQNSPSDVWVINHNLGYFPTVNVYSTGGAEIIADVLNVSVNQIQVSFATPTSGYARLI